MSETRRTLLTGRATQPSYVPPFGDLCLKYRPEGCFAVRLAPSTANNSVYALFFLLDKFDRPTDESSSATYCFVSVVGVVCKQASNPIASKNSRRHAMQSASSWVCLASVYLPSAVLSPNWWALFPAEVTARCARCARCRQCNDSRAAARLRVVTL